MLVGALRPGLPIHLRVGTVHGSRLLPWRTILLLLLLLRVCVLATIPILGIIAGVAIAARLRLSPLLLLLLILLPVWILCAVLGVRGLILIVLRVLIAVASDVGCLAFWSSSPGRGGAICWSGLSAGIVSIRSPQEVWRWSPWRSVATLLRAIGSVKQYDLSSKTQQPPQLDTSQKRA